MGDSCFGFFTKKQLYFYLFCDIIERRVKFYARYGCV